MANSSHKFDFSYSEPLLGFSIASRFLARSISHFVWAFAFILSALFIFSRVEGLAFFGLFIGLVVLSRLTHLGKAETNLDLKGLSKNSKVEISRFISGVSRRVLLSACDRASLAGRKDLFAYFILARLINLSAVRDVLARSECDVTQTVRFLSGLPSQRGKATADPALIARDILTLSFHEAVASGFRAILPQHIFIALANYPDKAVARFFEQNNLSAVELRVASVQSSLRSSIRTRRSFKRFLPPERRMPHHVMNRAWTARPTPFLDRHSQDLTDRARIGDIGFLVGRENELETLISVLSRYERTNALLVGEEGVGRDVIVEHLAWRITRDEVPSELFDKRLVKLNFGSLSAGARSAGEIQEGMSRVIQEVLQAGNIILYIPDIHNLVEGIEGVSAVEMLKPILESAVIPLIGLTTPDKYSHLVERSSDFGAAFEMVRIQELSRDDSIRYLGFVAVLLESRERVRISAKAIVRAVELSSQLLRSKPLPRSAEDVLSEVVAAKHREKQKEVSVKDIEAAVTRRTGVPVSVAREKEAERLLNLEEELHRRIVDQEEGVNAIAEALREYRAGITATNRPIAVFLFVGPTGVGKTETAKVLSRIYFGGENKMLRLDMSEYQNPDAVSRFLGSQEQSTKGSLTELVRRQPYALVLLDEFEKSHPEILNLFLQVFDDGRLTDAFGTTVDFTNTIIIATSNAHSAFVKAEIEKGRAPQEIEPELKNKLVDYFKPELLNRFDRIIMFKPLGPGELSKIAEFQLEELSDLLAQRHGIELGFSGEVIERLSRLGYSPVYGARPLKYLIRDKIRSLLAEAILRRELARGSKARIVVEDGKFQIINIS